MASTVPGVQGNSSLRILALLAVAVTASGAAHATDLSVTVADARGKPVAQAVVLVRPINGSRAPAPATTQIVQQFQSFTPSVLPIAVGTTVQFPNLDRMRHHVYSFSPTHTFEIRLYSGEETPQVRFEQAGVVTLGCNIHDWMQGFIYVTDAPYFGATDAAGAVMLRDVPAGEYRVSVWHPQIAKEVDALSADVPAAGKTLALALGVNIEPVIQKRPDDDPLLARMHAQHK
jgi:plastocyanin